MIYTILWVPVLFFFWCLRPWDSEMSPALSPSSSSVDHAAPMLSMRPGPGQLETGWTNSSHKYTHTEPLIGIGQQLKDVLGMLQGTHTHTVVV